MFTNTFNRNQFIIILSALFTYFSPFLRPTSQLRLFAFIRFQSISYQTIYSLSVVYIFLPTFVIGSMNSDSIQ